MAWLLAWRSAKWWRTPRQLAHASADDGHETKDGDGDDDGESGVEPASFVDTVLETTRSCIVFVKWNSNLVDGPLVCLEPRLVDTTFKTKMSLEAKKQLLDACAEIKFFGDELGRCPNGTDGRRALSFVFLYVQ